MALVNHDSNGLPSRMCLNVQQPHADHAWEDARLGMVHCWGVDPLPDDAVERYCTPGCTCSYCGEVRAGLRPVLIMCQTKWEKLSPDERSIIYESGNG